MEKIDLSPLLKLNESTKPLWGIMSSQHMVEHLSQAVMLSNGRLFNDKCMNPEEKLPVLKRVLMSKIALPKGFVNTVIGAELKPLKNRSLESAIKELNSELNLIDHYFVQNPNARPINPTFGPLNKEEWLQFHNKHFAHHFSQFGLLD